MLLLSSTWASLGLLFLGVNGVLGNGNHYPESDDPRCTGNITAYHTTTLPVTHYVDVTVSRYVNVTVVCTTTSTITTRLTQSTTTTLHYTESTTQTNSATITNTRTTTATVPATITTYTTQTLISTTIDPCPTTCSISAGTVTLFFWPTNRPFTYPSTYVNTELGYTFTSPSVYMLIPTAKGINSLSQPVGPSTASWILPLRLDEVSTIVGGSITRQLTLSDLGTDCPQTAEPTAIATLVDSRCDPILAAPRQVSSWASPCNACGRLGLFDPPYAVPTLTGGLVPTSTPVTVTVVPTPTATPPPPPVGTILVVYYQDGRPVATATVPATGVSGTVTSSVALSSTPATTSNAAATTSSAAATTSNASGTTAPGSVTTPRSSSSTVSVSTLPTVTTAAATKMGGGLAWFALSIAVSLCLL